MKEPDITPEIRKWIEWYLYYLRKMNAHYEDVISRTRKSNPELDMTREFGIIDNINDEMTQLSFRLYLLDNPYYGDAANKQEWE
jgi:hypothetical protein